MDIRGILESNRVTEHFTTYSLGLLLMFLVSSTKSNEHGAVSDKTLAQPNITVEAQLDLQLASCPVVMGTFVLPFLTTLMSNTEAFKQNEIPPFLKTRVPQSPGNIEVRKYIKDTFQALQWNVEEDLSVQPTPFGPLQFVNVIATQNPSAKMRFVLACHYDSKLFPIGYIGAIDSAAPCAMLVNLARQLNTLLNFLESDVTLQMVFFDGEEALWVPTATDSLYGSRHLASIWENTVDTNDPPNNKLKNIAAFILLDLIGHPTTTFERFFTETDSYFSQLIQLELCLRSRGLLTRPTGSAPLFQGTRRAQSISDDHIPFQQRGVPVMHLITFPFPPTWHTLQDVESSLDYKVIDDVGRILRVFITNLIVEGAIRRG